MSCAALQTTNVELRSNTFTYRMCELCCTCFEVNRREAMVCNFDDHYNIDNRSCRNVSVYNAVCAGAPGKHLRGTVEAHLELIWGTLRAHVKLNRGTSGAIVPGGLLKCDSASGWGVVVATTPWRVKITKISGPDFSLFHSSLAFLHSASSTSFMAA